MVLKKRGNKSIIDSSIRKVKVGLITTNCSLIFYYDDDINILFLKHMLYLWHIYAVDIIDIM